MNFEARLNKILEKLGFTSKFENKSLTSEEYKALCEAYQKEYQSTLVDDIAAENSAASRLSIRSSSILSTPSSARLASRVPTMTTRTRTAMVTATTRMATATAMMTTRRTRTASKTSLSSSSPPLSPSSRKV